MKKIAICISGHIRTFNQCYNNIYSNIIEPLEHDYTVEVFFSTWNDGSNVESDILNKINIKYDAPIKFDMKSKNYLKYPRLCCHTTCDNATSMWFKCKSVFEMINSDFDIVFRLRPDIIYHKPIDLKIISNIESNKIYMANFHGRYEKVTKCMMDHFAFGDYESMKLYMTTYDNIFDYIKSDDIPHTAEGFLYKNLQNINIHRIEYKYDVMRMNGKIENVSI